MCRHLTDGQHFCGYELELKREMNTINYALNYIKYTLDVIQDECKYVQTILLEINQHRLVCVLVCEIIAFMNSHQIVFYVMWMSGRVNKYACSCSRRAQINCFIFEPIISWKWKPISLGALVWLIVTPLWSDLKRS